MSRSIVDRFGLYAERTAQKSPRRARKLLAKVFRLYGVYMRLNKSDQLPARGYQMQHCNRVMADSLDDSARNVVVSIFTPCEVMHAMDLQVVFPEGLSCYMTASHCEKLFLNQAEKSGVPDSFCSFHKQFIGMVEKGMLPVPDCIVNTTMVCDANQLSFRYLAEYYHVPHFVIDVPNESGEKNRDYVKAQLEEMSSFLEHATGKKLEQKKLEESMRLAQESLENYREILRLKAERSERGRMTDLMMDSFEYHVLLGSRETAESGRRMIQDLKKLPENGDRRTGVRIAWVHVLPYWQKAMTDIFNHNDRAEVISGDMSLDNLNTDLDWKDPYGSMADMLLEDSFNGPAERRINRVLEYARSMHADGIIYFCHWGCKQTLGSAALAARAFDEAGFPTLTLDGDGCDPRNIQEGQMLTRVQAFIEQLEARKK